MVAASTRLRVRATTSRLHLRGWGVMAGSAAGTHWQCHLHCRMLWCMHACICGRRIQQGGSGISSSSFKLPHCLLPPVGHHAAGGERQEGRELFGQLHVPLAWGVAAVFGLIFAGFALMRLANGIMLVLLSTLVRELGEWAAVGHVGPVLEQLFILHPLRAVFHVRCMRLVCKASFSSMASSCSPPPQCLQGANLSRSSPQCCCS